MTEKQAKKIFDKYNPASGVVRCPNGRAKTRKSLDEYARAAVNLYGIISRDEFVGIFNAQNEEQTTADEVYALLLPNVLKRRWYVFYKDYIVHDFFLRDFDMVSQMEKMQEGKLRYIPPKDLFKEYTDEWFEEDISHWENLREYMLETFDSSPNTYRAFMEIKNVTLQERDLKEAFEIIGKHNLVFQEHEQVQGFLDRHSAALNNCRLWQNKGHTPQEIVRMRADEPPKEPTFNRLVKVGANEDCPCGSGKKHKFCCKQVEESGSAQIPYADRKLFYETWHKLLFFVSLIYEMIGKDGAPPIPNFHDEAMNLKIREKLWEDPEVIDEILDRVDSFTADEVALMRSWQEKHIKGNFMLMEYTPEHALFMRTDTNDPPRLYAVKGMATSIQKVMSRKLPVMLDTVLLPFKDHIVYDTFLASHRISFGSGITEGFDKEFDEEKRRHGIISKL